MAAQHREHGRPRYQKGCTCEACVAAGTTKPCRCQVCVAANRAYKRRNDQLRVISSGGDAPDRTGPRAETNPDRLVETKVQAELDLLGKAAEDKPGLAAGALAMGRLLDDPLSGPQHPAAFGQLRAALKEIRGTPAGARTSKLTAMRGGRGA